MYDGETYDLSSLMSFFACGPGSLVLIDGVLGMVPPGLKFDIHIDSLKQSEYRKHIFLYAFITIAYPFLRKSARTGRSNLGPVCPLSP